MSQPDLLRLPETNPLEIYRLRDGLYAVDLLTAALVHFDFFTWLAANPGSRTDIGRGLGLAERPLDVMLTLFTALGLVESQRGEFRVTLRAREHLLRSSPWFLGPYYASLKDRPVCRDFVNVLRTGRPANWGSFKDEKEWAKAMEQAGFADQFTAAMDCRGVYLGGAVARVLDFGSRTSVLDIAGGSGIYACALVAAHPQLRATVLERPPVDQVAERKIRERGLAGRVSVVAGDMLATELPAGYDVHLFSNVLHDWDEPVVIELLAKSYRALAPGGMVVIHDMHLHEDKSGPLPVAQYSCLLMHSTEGKCYSLSELRGYFERVGFQGMQFIPTVADRSLVLGFKPGGTGS
ncbi:MAG TPA: methyltransferase [Methylomirabilota bacterium]|nr:methyltransferase [Methylomirabilota bacterium]